MDNNQSSSTRRDNPFEEIRKKISACIQCGTCTASCPNEFAMEVTPRHLWRMILSDEPAKAVFASPVFLMCSSCYCCTLRCPRGLPLTEVMADLKQLGVAMGHTRNSSTARFYRNFLESVRKHGRVQEMELMVGYFWKMKNPLLPLHYASLGFRLMKSGKIPLSFSSRGQPDLHHLFQKVRELENQE